VIFLLQLAAVLAAGVFAALAWASRPRPEAVARSLVVIAGALAYIVFWGHLRTTVDTFRANRISWRSVPAAQAAYAGAPPEPGFQIGFAEWIRERIEPGSVFYLVPSPTQDEAVKQWFTYRLLPSLSTYEPQKADWFVFYGTTPAEAGISKRVVGASLRYAAGYTIARVRHAG
jgi:hypothetical protein